MSGGGGKVCESCKSGKAILYCRVDSAFLCMGCDNRIHGAGRNGHERVWMCDVCEQAPGSVNCKADAAVLCVSCDRDIHSANPLALRHERYPVSPFHHSSAPSVKTTNDFNLIFSNDDDYNNDILVNSSQAAAVVEVNYSHTEKDDHQVEAAAPWMMLTHPKKFVEDKPTFDVAKSIGEAGAGAGGGGDYFFSDADPYLDLEYVPSMEINFHNNHQGHQKTSTTSAVSDGVVPEQKNSTVPPSLPPPSQLSSSSSLSTSVGHGQYYIDFTGGGSKPLTTTQSYYSSTTPKSLAKTVSSSSLDAGVVPDGSSSEGGSVVATQLCALDREARVLRYREKRKNRKFEKTIRYASRKAYAETRPRVKGRFVKRTDNTETEEAASVVAIHQNQMYPYTPSSMLAFMSDAAGFGVVPTF